MSAHEYEFTSIDGMPLPLSQFAGKAMLIANTASACGYTPQYRDLQTLSERYFGREFVVIGVPSNDFGGQEPGTEAEIASFCSAKDGITFPMTQIYAVIGDNAHPLYKWIADPLGEDHAPRWNFHKHLIGPQGERIGVRPSPTKPLSREITDTVEQAIDQG